MSGTTSVVRLTAWGIDLFHLLGDDLLLLAGAFGQGVNVGIIGDLDAQEGVQIVRSIRAPGAALDARIRERHVIARVDVAAGIQGSMRVRAARGGVRTGARDIQQPIRRTKRRAAEEAADFHLRFGWRWRTNSHRRADDAQDFVGVAAQDEPAAASRSVDAAVARATATSGHAHLQPIARIANPEVSFGSRHVPVVSTLQVQRSGRTGCPDTNIPGSGE